MEMQEAIAKRSTYKLAHLNVHPIKFLNFILGLYKLIKFSPHTEEELFTPITRQFFFFYFLFEILL